MSQPTEKGRGGGREETKRTILFLLHLPVCVCVCVKYTLLLRFCVGLVKSGVRTFANEILHHRNDCYY